MLVPSMFPVSKSRDYISCFRVDSRKIRSFVQIASITGQREIGRIIVAAMLSGDIAFYARATSLKGTADLRQSVEYSQLARLETDCFSNVVRIY